MTEPLPAQEFKSCCAEFYADEWVRRIIGDSFHPGGAELTRSMLVHSQITADHHLLDVAAGQGTSSLLAAEEFGCQVVALDLSEENLDRAQREARRRKLNSLVSTRRADAERLPFPNDTFDVLLCECAFCTFPDKSTAASEMARVLRPGGCLALSDMVVDRLRFPSEMNSLLMRVACIADAVPSADLAAGFTRVGFDTPKISDESWALSKMVSDIRQRLLGVELLAKLDKIDLGGVDLSEGKNLCQRAAQAIDEGIIGYESFLTRKL